MKRLLFGLLVMLVLAAGVLADAPTTAEDNNPRTNPDANACYIGGSLYGKCETTDVDMDQKITEEEINYMYTAGWYIIRFEKGVIPRSHVPRMYRWIMGPEPVVVVYPSADAPAVVTPEPTCTINISVTIGGSNIITAPLSVITGGVDPNANPRNPYGFDWVSNNLVLAVPSGSIALYFTSSGTWYSGLVVSTDCPTPIHP